MTHCHAVGLDDFNSYVHKAWGHALTNWLCMEQGHLLIRLASEHPAMGILEVGSKYTRTSGRTCGWWWWSNLGKRRKPRKPVLSVGMCVMKPYGWTVAVGASHR